MALQGVKLAEELVKFLVEHRHLHEHPNNEFLSRQVCSKLDQEWLRFLESLSYRELNTIPDQPGSLLVRFQHAAINCQLEPHIVQHCPPSLGHFFRRAKYLSLMTEPLVRDAGARTTRYKGIAAKKAHEVKQLARLIQAECEDSIDRLVDVGCGVGHLCGYMESRLGRGIEVVGVDSNAVLCQKGRWRYGHNGTVRFENDQFKMGDAVLRRKLIGEEPTRRTALVCLHGCGDLQAELLREFVDLNSTRSRWQSNTILFTVGCCYHKMSLTEWPMSRIVANLLSKVGYRFSTPSFRLACQEGMSRWREMSDEEHRAHENAFARRALFECLPSERSGKGAYRRFVKSIGNGSGSAREEILMLAHQHSAGLAAIEAYTALQFALQAPLETLVLLDRMLYLEENGLFTRLEALFESRISPRNMCIVATGHEE